MSYACAILCGVSAPVMVQSGRSVSQSERSVPSTGFTVLAAGQAPVPAGAQYRHSCSVVCLTSSTRPRKPGANQCLPSPDVETPLHTNLECLYKAVISVLPRLGVFAPA